MFQYGLALLVLAGGLFSVVCAAKDYDWFMESRKAQRLTRIIGRKAARIFYMILGACMACAGVVLLIGAATGRLVLN